MSRGYRQDRLAEEIRRIISEMLLKELKDPRLSGFISITEVEVTRDNSYATCYITVLETQKDEKAKAKKEQDVLDGLRSASGKMRGKIGKELKLRRAPELIFKFDRSEEYGRHIDEVIRGIENGNY
ncbi:MAG: 30S ribosome-binding factor RbfA [Eubacterium sp.]